MEVRKDLLYNLIKQAKSTPISIVGIDVTPYNLTREEKKFLIERGLSLHIGRYKQLVLTYPQRLRAKDLKDKVTQKMKTRKNE